jgi:hypothetical protein
VDVTGAWQKQKEAAQYGSDISMQDDYGVSIWLRPYGYLVRVQRDTEDKVLSSDKLVTFEDMEASKLNPLKAAIDRCIAELG